MKSQCEDRQQLLIEALESGRYPKTRGRLCKIINGEHCFCVLGIACDIYGLHNPGTLWEEVAMQDRVPYVCFRVGHGLVTSTSLPGAVARWFNMTILGELTRPIRIEGQNYKSLAGLNDRGWSFKALAGVIKKLGLKPCDFVEENHFAIRRIRRQSV